MARSDEAQAFFHAVYSAAQQIPYGKVTTYAHLAYLVGTRTFNLMENLHSSYLKDFHKIGRWAFDERMIG
jgi:alkylated DNA nucleotide flippase Atl1